MENILEEIQQNGNKPRERDSFWILYIKFRITETDFLNYIYR